MGEATERVLTRNRGDAMNMVLWVLQIILALLYGASGIMKVFMFDKISGDVPSFGALPREAWMALGILELACSIGLIVPAAFRWRPRLTVLAAAVLAVESLVFIGVHVGYGELAPTVFGGALGLIMVFVAFGRAFLRPILPVGKHSPSGKLRDHQVSPP
jgi:uncharacterized membrane protein YphA (DoxX/SURF4 family)